MAVFVTLAARLPSFPKRCEEPDRNSSFARRSAPWQYPTTSASPDSLPKTRSGKIMRRLLRNIQPGPISSRRRPRRWKISSCSRDCGPTKSSLSAIDEMTPPTDSQREEQVICATPSPPGPCASRPCLQDTFTGKMVIAGTFDRLCVGKKQAARGETISFSARRERPSADRARTPLSSPSGPRRAEGSTISRVGSTAALYEPYGSQGDGAARTALRGPGRQPHGVANVESSVRSDDPLSTIEAVIPIPQCSHAACLRFCADSLSNRTSPRGFASRDCLCPPPRSGESQETGGEKP